jgi:6-phosphogluconolactonase/glucosamine-6-phosphate isomerase/deaminase
MKDQTFNLLASNKMMRWSQLVSSQIDKRFIEPREGEQAYVSIYKTPNTDRTTAQEHNLHNSPFIC